MLVDMANGKTFGQFGNNAIAYAGGVDVQYPGSDPKLAYPTIFSDPSFARRARTSFPQIVPHSIPAWRDTPLGISARDDDNFEFTVLLGLSQLIGEHMANYEAILKTEYAEKERVRIRRSQDQLRRDGEVELAVIVHVSKRRRVRSRSRSKRLLA